MIESSPSTKQMISTRDSLIPLANGMPKRFEALAAEALGAGDVFDPSEGDKTGLVHGGEPEVAAAAALLPPAELLVRAAAAAIYEEDDEAKLLAAVRKAEAS